jgi:hypothetical protein
MDVTAQIDQLFTLKTPALKQKYRQVLGDDPKSSNRQFLIRRIAWQMQARALGGLSERARQRIDEIADDADLRVRPPRDFVPAPVSTVTARQLHGLPPAGTLLTRRYNGRDIVVKVLKDGFEYQARKYRSLSAVAREVTGTQWNGPRFFGIRNA